MSLLERDGSKKIEISALQYDGIQKCLTELTQKTKATALLLSDINGQLIAHNGNIRQINTSVLSALAASDFAATSEMAKIVGEKARFRLLFHEGETNNVYLSNVGENHFLVIVFNTNVTLGVIKVYTKKAVEALLEIVGNSSEFSDGGKDILNTEFNLHLNDALDNIFKK